MEGDFKLFIDSEIQQPQPQLFHSQPTFVTDKRRWKGRDPYLHELLYNKLRVEEMELYHVIDLIEKHKGEKLDKDDIRRLKYRLVTAKNDRTKKDIRRNLREQMELAFQEENDDESAWGSTPPLQQNSDQGAFQQQTYTQDNLHGTSDHNTTAAVDQFRGQSQQRNVTESTAIIENVQVKSEDNQDDQAQQQQDQLSCMLCNPSPSDSDNQFLVICKECIFNKRCIPMSFSCSKCEKEKHQLRLHCQECEKPPHKSDTRRSIIPQKQVVNQPQKQRLYYDQGNDITHTAYMRSIYREVPILVQPQLMVMYNNIVPYYSGQQQFPNIQK